MPGSPPLPASRLESQWAGWWSALAVAGRRSGLEGGDPFLPGGLGVGAWREAAGEFQQDHAVGEGEDRAGELGVAGGVGQGRGGAVLQARGKAVAGQRLVGHL